MNEIIKYFYEHPLLPLMIPPLFSSISILIFTPWLLKLTNKTYQKLKQRIVTFSCVYLIVYVSFALIPYFIFWNQGFKNFSISLYYENIIYITVFILIITHKKIKHSMWPENEMKKIILWLFLGFRMVYFPIEPKSECV
jgi:hypothetical protein